MNLGLSFRLRAWHGLIALASVTLVALSCSSDSPPLADLAQGCLVNSDCNDPLVCAFRKCHNACTTTRDCMPGLRCVASDRPYHVCQLDTERKCTYNSDCPRSQVCAVDGQCRDQCQGDADCLAEQACVSGSCAERAELNDAGMLPVAAKDSGPSTGQPCVYNSQCPSALVCRSGFCQIECLTSVDCSDGRQCIGNRCQVPVCPEVDAGAGKTCAFSSDCTAPLICRSGTCTCECRQSGDCPTGYDCVGNRCAPSNVDSVGPEGGMIVSPDRRLTLSIPAGALSVRVRLTIELAEAWPSGALGPVFEVRPSGTTFTAPVTFIYRYQPADISPYPAASVRVAVATGSTWTALPTTIDVGMGTATAQASHLSTYGLISSDAGTPPVDGGSGQGEGGGTPQSLDASKSFDTGSF
jgi:hypothetical protein